MIRNLTTKLEPPAARTHFFRHCCDIDPDESLVWSLNGREKDILAVNSMVPIIIPNVLSFLCADPRFNSKFNHVL